MRTLQHLIIGLVVIAIPNFGFSQEIDYTQFKTSDEENNIDIFKLASPSVVHITNSRLFRSFASLNPQEVPQGTGTGFPVVLRQASVLLFQ